jgi:hypothetical protein
MKSHRLFILGFAALAGTTSLATARAQSGAAAPASIAGTYQLQICRGACDGARPDVVQGRLVIEDSTYSSASIPEPGGTYARRESGALLIRGHGREDPNSCFALRKTPDSRSLAGYPPVGFTAWHLDSSGGTARLRLGQTADASYVLELRMAENGVVGRGMEHGPSGTETVVDSVTITRLGPPDRTICTAAAIRGGANMQVVDSIRNAIYTPRSAVRPEGVPGTYEIEICPDRCRRGGRRSIRGIAVLEDTTFYVNQLTPTARRYAIEKSRDLLITATHPNACFVFERVGTAASYAGKQPIGFTRWYAVEPAGTLRIDLFETHDGEYTARLVLVGDRLSGEGWSLVKNPFDHLIPSDVIRGRRVGPPDRGLCIRAAERAAADLPPAP